MMSGESWNSPFSPVTASKMSQLLTSVSAESPAGGLPVLADAVLGTTPKQEGVSLDLDSGLRNVKSLTPGGQLGAWPGRPKPQVLARAGDGAATRAHTGR